MIKWKETAMKKKTIALFFALMITASGTGCQAIKKIFIKPPEGVTEKSYPVKAYAYQLSLVFHTSPQELMDYFGKDISWLEKGAGALQVDTTKLKPHTDMTEVGQSVDFSFRMLGINFPCRMISLKYKPNGDLWWMMALPSDSWILLRFGMKPIAEGCGLSLDVLGQPPKYLEAVIDSFQLVEAAALRADLVLTLIQAEFDPELDVEKVTAKGLRGELYETLLQADEASIWVNASPEEVAEYIVTNLESYLPEMKLEEECNLEEFINMQEGQIIHCPAAFKFLSLNLDLDTFFNWIEKDKNHVLRVYAPGRENLVFVDFSATPEAGGSRVQAVVVNEIPGPTSQRLVDIMMALAAIPKHLRRELLDIKQGVEGVG
jgi:hypothetical protein